MKKVIELALKSGEITLKGVINLVDCLSETKQERAIMLLTENNDIPDEVKILTKGISFDSEGNIAYEYTCVGYNYLDEEVIVKKHCVQKECNDFTTSVSLYAWKGYRKNYIDQQVKEREEYIRKQQEQNAAE